MGLIRVNWSPNARERRWFGAAALIGTAVLGLLLYRGWLLPSRPSVAVGLWGAGALIGGLGLTGTRAVLPFYWALTAVSLVIGTVVSWVLLTLLYGLLVLPLGLVMRLTGRDRLQLRRPPPGSCWHPVDDPHDPERLF